MAVDDRAEFDPKEIASAAFPTVFRGYDQEAVREYLTRLAAAVGRAQQLGILGSIDHDETSAHLRAAEAEREAAELRARVTELEALVESGFDMADDAGPGTDDHTADSSVAGVDADDVDQGGRDDDEPGSGSGPSAQPEHIAASSTAIDEAELIEQLGQETAKILETARAAAANIAERAEREAARTEREAAEDARRVRDEAENDLAAARVEAKRITNAASDEAAQIQQRLEAEAQRAYDDARDEADRIVTEAGAKVERDLAAARQRAEHIVTDAEGVREEVLGDLVRRRRVHRSQLSRLTDARDRLARALAAARSELDEVATTIDVATGSGSLDLTEPEPEPATGALDSEAVAELIARLDHARAEAGSVGGTSTTANVTNGVHATVGAHAAIDDDTVQLLTSSGPTSGTGGAGSDLDNGVLVIDADGPTTDAVTTTADPTDPADVDTGVPVDRDPHDTGVTTVDQDPVVLDPLERDGFERDPLDGDPLDGSAFVVADDAGDDGDRMGRGDDRRSDPDPLASESTAGGSDADDGPQSYREQAAQAIDELHGPIDGDRLLDQLGFTDDRVLGTEGGVMARHESRGDLPRNAPYAGRPPELFEQRDLAMAKATPGFRRRLKRAVNDDQSDVLDRLRAGRKHIDVDELPPLEEQLTGYIAALTPALRDVVVAGARVLGADDAPLPAVDNLCLQLAKHIVDNLRLATIDVIEASPDVDRESILDPVRAIYRDFRNTLLPDLIDDALHEAFALGVFHAIEADRDVLWVVDPRLDADPVCEDNSASPPLPKGTEFPSGHARPLSMPGCRCLAVPAR